MMTKLLSNRCFKVFMYVALFAITFVATSAYADGEVFTKISDKMISTFKSVRSITPTLQGAQQERRRIFSFFNLFSRYCMKI